MWKKDDKKVIYFDQEEKEMMEELDLLRQQWVASVVPDDADDHMKKTFQAAKDYTKRKTISLRVLERDIKKLKIIAMKKWIPYQTYINMVLHERIEQDYLKPASEIIL